MHVIICDFIIQSYFIRPSTCNQTNRGTSLSRRKEKASKLICKVSLTLFINLIIYFNSPSSYTWDVLYWGRLIAESVLMEHVGLEEGRAEEEEGD